MTRSRVFHEGLNKCMPILVVFTESRKRSDQIYRIWHKWRGKETSDYKNNND